MAPSDPEAPPSQASSRLVWGVWALLAAIVLGVAAHDATQLGLYYDEAFMAQQARDFVDVSRPSTHPGSVRTIEVFGRPFPTFNAAYLGSLKSQLTIPSFALFGASPRVLRLTTCAIALIALLFAMRWVAALYGAAPAIVMGLLAASDPTVFFFSQFEWGPFTTNLLCRAFGAWAVLAAWRSTGLPKLAWAGAAGLALGLGIYSRADFAIVPACAGLSILAFRRDLVAEGLREHRTALALGAGLLLLASSPMWTHAGALFSTGEAIADRGDLADRYRLLTQTLDGTRFHRLMEAGGVFERAADASAEPSALLGCAFGSFALLLLETLRRRGDAASRRDVALRAWLLSTTLLVTLAMLALPGAVRAHHQLNVFPLWHVVIGVAVCDLFVRPWRDPKRAMLARTLVTVAIGFVVVGGIASIARTRAFIEDTGGRGRWSHALLDFAEDIEQSGSEAVSLDWGFHEPLLFSTRTARLREAIWEIPLALRTGRAWAHRGDASTRYLVHPPAYDLFGVSPLLLDFARASDLEVEDFRDAGGEIAFHVVRVPRAHVLVFDGRFRLE
jgi:hypothetical protein